MSVILQTENTSDQWNQMIAIVTICGRGVTYHEGIPPIKLHDALITCSFKTMWQTKNIISLLPESMVYMATTFDRKITWFDELLSIKLHGSLITWLCKITCQTETIISPPPQCLQPPNLAKLWLMLKGFYP